MPRSSAFLSFPFKEGGAGGANRINNNIRDGRKQEMHFWATIQRSCDKISCMKMVKAWEKCFKATRTEIGCSLAPYNAEIFDSNFN